jgi:predicted transcriptional regulator
LGKVNRTFETRPGCGYDEDVTNGDGEDESRPLATEAEAKAVASAVRLRILRMCLDTALTNKEIAERLGANPATALHHVRTLVATGFLVAEESRLGARGSREIPYRATRKSWSLRFGEQYHSDMTAAMLQVFQSEIAQLDDPAQVNVYRVGLRLDQGQYEDLERRLRGLFDEFGAMEPGPGSQPYSLFLAIHPDLGRE